MFGDKWDASSSPQPDHSQVLDARRALRALRAGQSEEPQSYDDALRGDSVGDSPSWPFRDATVIVTTSQQPWYGHQPQGTRPAKFVITVAMTGLIAFFAGAAIGAGSAPQSSSAAPVAPVTVTATVTPTTTATTTVEAPAPTVTVTEGQSALAKQPIVAEQPRAIAERTSEEQPVTPPVEAVPKLADPAR